MLRLLVALCLVAGCDDGAAEDPCVASLTCPESGCPNQTTVEAEYAAVECDVDLCNKLTYACDDFTVVSWGHHLGGAESYFDADGTLVARYETSDTPRAECAGEWSGGRVSCARCADGERVVERGGSNTLPLGGCPR